MSRFPTVAFVSLSLLTLGIQATLAETASFGQGGSHASCPELVKANQFETPPGVAVIGQGDMVTCGVKAKAAGKNRKGVKVTLLGEAFDLASEETVAQVIRSAKTKKNGWASFSFPIGNPTGNAIGFVGQTNLSGNKKLNEVWTVCSIGSASQCNSGPTTLCLDGNRFRAEVAWTDPFNNENRDGQASSTGNSSGVFQFAPLGDQLIIDLLDRCSDTNQPNFWVFASGTTNVEFTLTVTDTQTGAIRSYTNPRNTPFQSITDTSAFATCP